MRDFEVIHYHLFNLNLQEPLALIYNWFMAILCLYYYFKLDPDNQAGKDWKLFFLIFSITCFFGGLAHTFYHYIGDYGKIPHWIGGLLFSFFAARGMIGFLNNSKFKENLFLTTKMKFVFFLILTLTMLRFTYVTIDAALTYLLFCGGVGIYLWKNGVNEAKYFVFGMFTVVLAGICFLAKVDISIYFNREDFSHIFILVSVVLFYSGTKRIEKLRF